MGKKQEGGDEQPPPFRLNYPLHYVLHAPQGDTYADLLFTMIERNAKRPPVTYTTFQARDLGGDTAELFKTAASLLSRALRYLLRDEQASPFFSRTVGITTMRTG